MLMVGLLTTACGAEPNPVEQCDDLVDVLCGRGVQCLGGSHSECVTAVRAELPCGSAKSVSGTYDRCIDQLQSASCSVLFATSSTGDPELRLPADCRAVILYAGAPQSELDVPHGLATTTQAAVVRVDDGEDGPAVGPREVGR